MELKKGDKVKVLRRIGPDDPGAEVTGTINYFSETVKIGGERTAHIIYDDVGSYYHALSKIKPAL